MDITRFKIFRYFFSIGAKVKIEKQQSGDIENISGTVLKSQIDTWKKEFGGVYCYISDDMKIGYFQAPTLLILDRCECQSNGSKLRFNKLLVDSCWLGGDETLKTSEKHLLGLYKWLPFLTDITEGVLAKI